jgi:superfamily II DNA/RNA helicase
MENFYELKLPQPLLLALEKMKFSKPTPIQAQAIPPALEGRDVLGTAQTGTGKTAAFAIPMLARLMAQRPQQHGHGQKPHGMALVMTPTRELAMQVNDAIKLMLNSAQHIRSALLIGGQSMHNQLQQLRQHPRIIVGTPGRINDHLQQTSLSLSTCDFLVLDETDRMLDMGFGPQIERIVKRMPKARQTLMFSATMPEHIVKVSQQYLDRPVRVAVGAVNQPIKAIKQEIMHMQVAEKYEALLRELRARAGSVLVFVRTKRGADRIAKKLNADKHHAAAIHGNLNQNQRNRVIQAFRDMKHRVMVATDVAARGLDIPHIEHVINYDLPQVAEDYIHRIGRTARAGKEGQAVCFITPEDGDLWREIHKLLHPGEKLPPRSAHAPPPRQARGHGGNPGGNPGGGQRSGQGRGPRQHRGQGRQDGRTPERRVDSDRRSHEPRREEGGHRPRQAEDRRDGGSRRENTDRRGSEGGERRRDAFDQGEHRQQPRSPEDRHRVGLNRSGFAHRKSRKKR